MNPIELAATLAEGTYKAQRAEGYSILFSFCSALAVGLAVMKERKHV